MQQAVNLIKSSESVLILTHKNPDGDAIGSALGLACGLRSIGKEVEYFSKDNPSEVFKFLHGFSIIKNKIISKHYDLVILLDCTLFSRTGIDNIKDIASSFDYILIIDHHPKGKTECDYYDKCVSVIEPQTSSTAVLIYELFKKTNIKITKDIANCLLTGIFTDTCGFKHSNTDSQSLKVAAEFMKRGSRIDKITKNIFSNKSIAAIKLWGLALKRVKTDPKTSMAVSYISKKDIEYFGAKEEDLSGLINIINTISDARFSLLLTESENNKIKGSLRSENYKGVDVSKIARNFGGGGHKLASGFEFEGCLEDSVTKINEMIEKSKNQK